LIEVMAVVVLLGLLAGATVWSLAGDAHRHSKGELVSRIIQMDAQTRLAAARSGQTFQLQFDLDSQSIRRIEANDAAMESASHRLVIASDYRINQMVTSQWNWQSSESDGQMFKRIKGGTLSVTFGVIGCSASYALQIMHEPTGETQWLMLAGLTGQATVVKNESDFEDIFAWLGGARTDAH